VSIIQIYTLFPIFQKFLEIFFFCFEGIFTLSGFHPNKILKKSKSQEKPENILQTALTPLFRPPKIPYIRGGTAGRGVWFEGRG